MLRILGVAALVGSSACLPTYEAGSPTTNTNPADDTHGPQSTANTSNDPVAVRPTTPADESAMWLSAGDAAAIADRALDEGPIEVASRNHACMKVKYETVGRLLNGFGVDMGTLPVTAATTCPTGDPTNTNPAKFVYCDARLTLGYPLYEARLAEATSATTASSTKMLDLFVTAAVEIIAANTAAQGTPAANTPGARYKAQCVNGAGTVTPLFTTSGGTTTCNAAALTCIQGYPATDDLVALCNRVLTQAVSSGTNTALDNGKRIALAAVLGAAHSCE